MTTQLKNKYYIRSVDKRWKDEIVNCSEEILVFSPYVTPNTVHNVLKDYTPEKIKIYTTFSVMNFISGASSLKTLKVLIQRGCTVCEIDGLHAKVLISNDNFATIGSQNMTFRGTRNKEATTIIKDKSHVRHIFNALQPWIKQSKLITLDMIAALEVRMPELQRKYFEIESDSMNIELVVKEGRFKNLITPLIKAAKETIKEIQDLEGRIPIEIARAFIRASAWWIGHPVRPARAPKHQDNLYGTEENWMIDFGNNTFLISKAINRCLRTIETFLSGAKDGYVMDRKKLLKELRLDISGAVATASGNEYVGYYPIIDHDMKFGTQSIDVKDFIDHLFKLLPIDNIYAAEFHEADG